MTDPEHVMEFVKRRAIHSQISQLDRHEQSACQMPGDKERRSGTGWRAVIGPRSQILPRTAAETHEVLEQYARRRIAFRRAFSKAPMYDSFEFLGNHGISLRDRPPFVFHDLGHRRRGRAAHKGM